MSPESRILCVGSKILYSPVDSRSFTTKRAGSSAKGSGRQFQFKHGWSCGKIARRQVKDTMECDDGDGDGWIWVMKEYGKFESWSVHYKPKTEGKFDVIRVFQLIVNGDILAYYRKLKVYNLETMSFTKLMKFGACSSYVEMEPYVESLELVDKESATTCGETVLSWTEDISIFLVV
ncbi:hypothetical protein L1987_31248 [Smallanthus sonchifolius]|uniref:Uncharacterized protein n=1 Tax=Smallanthus sonchifolius TaxID=185202 RepID=A0ACB9I514_9ASTR|nr:hypothetical protein L1987_31248 [Smallanthus sonchifolius]